MPYIPESDRRKYAAKDIYTFEKPGQLNFAMTDLVVLYLKDKGVNYQSINDIMGVFASAQAEFYRRIAGPYENTKIQENSDVYNLYRDEFKINNEVK